MDGDPLEIGTSLRVWLKIREYDREIELEEEEKWAKFHGEGGRIDTKRVGISHEAALACREG